NIAQRLRGAMNNGDGKGQDSSAQELHAVLESLLAGAREAKQKLADQEEKIALLEELSTTDELTQVLNRRGLEQEFRNVLGRADRLGEEGVLIYVDLDEFKPVNDKFGHAAGDEVLRSVARTLYDSVRTTDSVARMGGDEFCVLLVNTNRHNGLTRAEQLDHELNELSVVWEGKQIHVGATFGVQAFGKGDTAQQIIESADSSMYRIKQVKGQNRAAGRAR
ncbi:MAG: GGDEF domain-containing protein, partial [Rhodospirillales bacterium]|nr:GGDEF domain-containing protein [Rhodospirillales bacterium]